MIRQVKRAALGIPARTAHELGNVWILARSGMIAPMRPDRLARVGWIGARWGASPAAGVLAGAARHPNRTMIIDELGELTYSEVDRRSSAVAAGLMQAGVREGDRVGVMCRDHRGFVDSVMGVAKLGGDVLLLNTSFAAPQLTEVCRREDAAAVIYDEEFTELIAEAGRGRLRFVAWHEGDSADDPLLRELIEAGEGASVSPPGPDRPGDDPHLRHHGHAQGRFPHQHAADA